MAANNIEQLSKKEASRMAEIVINRIILMFIAATAGVMYIINSSGLTAIEQMELFENKWKAAIVPAISLVLFIAAAVFFIIRRSSSIDDRRKTINSYTLLFYSIGFFVISALIWLYQTSLSSASIYLQLLIAVIAVAVVYFVYYLYQREFFVYTIFTACGTYLIFMSENKIMNILIFVVAVALLVCTLFFRAKKGEVAIAGRTHTIAPHNSKYIPYYILAAVLITAGAVLLLTSYILYMVIAVLALYIAVGIYYTVKLI